MPELFIDGWYRAPGGVATMEFPELPQGWVLRYADTKAGRTVQLTRQGALLTFTFVPSTAKDLEATDLKLAQVVAQHTAQGIAKELPYLKATRNADDLPLKGGFAAARFMEGKSEAGHDEVVIVAAVADGNAVVVCLCRALKSLLDEAWGKLGGVALESAKFGKHVPRLPDMKPDVKLDGIWQGPTDWDFSNTLGNRYRWLVADPRGWFHERTLYTERELDLEAMYQWRPELVKRYRIRDGNFEQLDAEGKQEKFWHFKQQGEVLFFGKDRYDFIQRDGELTLDGCWEASTYYVNQGYGDTFTFSSSSRYFFTKEGKFSMDSFSSMSSVDDANYPPLDGFRSWAHAYSETPVRHGRYKIVGNLLLLAFADGRRATKVITFSGGNDLGLAFISGSPYLIQE